MKEITVNFDKKKRIKILLFGALIVLVCLTAAYCMVSFSEKIRIYPVLGMIVCAVFGVFMIFGSVKNLLKKNDVGLILNSAGIIFKGTPNARKVGNIAWNDIESISVGTAYSSPFIFLKLLNPEKYCTNISPQFRQNIIDNGVGITNDELSIEFDDMKNLISQYFNHYK